MNKIINYILIFIGLFALSFVYIKVFFFDIFHVSSNSMENTLKKGDFILVVKNKKINRELAVFKESQSKQFMVKRCVGLPGEVISIHDNLFFHNNVKLKELSLVKHSYYLYGNPFQINTFLDSLKIHEKKIINQNTVFCLIDNRYFNLIKTESCIDSLIKLVSIENKKWNAFPYSQFIGWTFDEFGPLYLPQKGDTIKLNKDLTVIYRSLIDEKNKYSLSTINQKKQLLITDNYYFMLGDNRSQSADSRAWGIVPEKNIVGKTSLVLFSYDGQWDWDRFLKRIE